MKSIFFKGRFIFIPLAVAAFLTLVSFVVMQLWNNLIPVIFHLGVITFWQAMGIFILCKLLFGFGKGGRGFGRGGASWMRHRMEDRFKNMTPEEREKFKQKLHDHCGWGHHRDHFGRGGWGNYGAEAPAAEEPKV
jgi:hypothetical protein